MYHYYTYLIYNNYTYYTKNLMNKYNNGYFKLL